MFNRTNVFLSEQPSYGYAEIKEVRAPTDDSVRLLREMEEKAREQVLKTVRLEDNVLKSVIHTYRNPLSCDVKFCVQLELNGRRLEKIITTSEWETHEQQMVKLFDSISKLIANEIMNSSYLNICDQLKHSGIKI
jgi:hypothetical protein